MSHCKPGSSGRFTALLAMMVVRPPTWDLALRNLSQQDLEHVQQALSPRVFPARSLLFEEAQTNPNLYIIRSGRVRAFHVDPSGRERTTQLFGPGFIAGLITCLTASPPVLSIQAMEPVAVFSISQARLLELLRTLPELSVNINVLLASMHREHMIRGKRTSDPARVRLGKVLCTLAAPPEPNDKTCDAVIRDLTQQDISNLVGTSRTWVSLMLAEFEANGILSRSRGVIRITSWHALSKLVDDLERA